MVCGLPIFTPFAGPMYFCAARCGHRALQVRMSLVGRDAHITPKTDIVQRRTRLPRRCAPRNDNWGVRSNGHSEFLIPNLYTAGASDPPYVVQPGALHSAAETSSAASHSLPRSSSPNRNPCFDLADHSMRVAEVVDPYERAARIGGAQVPALRRIRRECARVRRGDRCGLRGRMISAPTMRVAEVVDPYECAARIGGAQVPALR